MSSSNSASTTDATTSPPYISPATRVDPQTGIAVLVVINDSGQVTEQIPTRQVIDEYRRHQDPASQEGQHHAASNPPPAPSADQSTAQVAGASTVSPGSAGSGSQGTSA